MDKSEKDLVLFVNTAPADAVHALQAYSKRLKKSFKSAVIFNSQLKKPHIDKDVDFAIACRYSSSTNIIKTLKPYQSRLAAIVCRGEKHVADLARLVPFIPYLKTPSSDSLMWSTDKIAMRLCLSAYNQAISPRFMVIKTCSAKGLRRVEHEIGFPLVVKPANLASSFLVTICFHAEELEQVLKKTFKKIKKIYKDNGRGEEPKVLIEQFMDGEMYSIDAYVDSCGKIDCCPPVLVKTGRSIGFDDFFNYSRITPTNLSKAMVAAAEAVTCQAVHALGLRSTSAHVELMYVDGKFKVIELGPRLGGFRHKMYKLSFGIDHALNDILIRMGQRPVMPKKTLGHTAVLRFYPFKEGTIKKINGVKYVKSLKSLVTLTQNKKIGDRCQFAKNGGRSVFDVILFNPKRSELLADIRRLEKNLIIST